MTVFTKIKDQVTCLKCKSILSGECGGRLTRELNEALQRQRATAEVLGAISRSKFELQSILQSVVDTASQLCRADGL